MGVSASRLRRWFAAALVLVCAVVAGAYFYARHRVQNALKQVPQKIGIEIQQSADQFTISKSLQGRTVFKLQASKAVQFKSGGHAELHNVTITFYGRDSSRFDQVYGKEFDYDPISGNVSSVGEVSIDLQPNPQGSAHRDQAVPKELKNPIHLKTSNVVFNKNTGDAWTNSELTFRVPQGSGSALGAKYAAKEGVLTLESAIKIVMAGRMPGIILAERAALAKAPLEIVLTHPRVQSPEEEAQADELTLWLNEDNTLEHASATGNVKMISRDLAGEVTRARRTKSLRLRSRQAALALSELTAQHLDVSMGADDAIKDAVFSGGVRIHSEGTQLLNGSMQRAVLDFGGNNSLRKIHAEGGVTLEQNARASEVAEGGQGKPSLQNQDGTDDFQITSPAMDFLVANGRLMRAATAGPPEILLRQTDQRRTEAQPTVTHITADEFVASFDKLGQLSQVHGSANVRVVSPAPPQKGLPEVDRISTSDSIDAFFWPGGRIRALQQQGRFAYRSGSQEAFANSARYTPVDQVLTLSGSPRILDQGMETTADAIRMYRSSGDALAQGDVKTSYTDLKPQAGGAMLASSSPIHVTAQRMAAHAHPLSATYTGNARLWQNANVIDAPSIQFDKEQRTLAANSNGQQQVSTVLIGTDKKGNPMPVTVSSGHLVYRDSERKAHFDGGVTVRGADLTISAKQMDVFLGASDKNMGGRAIAPVPGSGDPQPLSPARLDKIVASGSVVITEPNRRAAGENLTYTASDDKFVLTGGPPSIFDAERGKITAVSLTLFRRDGRVVVEGDSSSPAVTEIRVVR